MKSQLKRGAIISYINIALSIVIGFIVSPLLIKRLGSSEYGVYQMTAALIGYISVLDFGLHDSVVRYVSKFQAKKEKEEQENFLAVSLFLFSGIAVIILAVGALLFNFADYIYHKSATVEEIELLKKLLIILVINLGISMPGAVFTSIINAYEHFVFSKLCDTVKLVLRFSAIVIMGFLGISALKIVLLDFILNTTTMLIQIIYCFVVLKIRFKIHYINRSYVLGIFSFSIFIFIAAVTEQINWKADTTILGILIGTKAVTMYSISGTLIGYYRSFTGAISGIFLPKAVKMVSKNKSNSELTDFMIKIGRIQLMIAGLILVGFISIGKEFIVLWVGNEFVDNYYYFLAMAIPLLVPMTQSIGINILEAKYMHKFRAVVYLLIAICNIFFTIFLVKLFGTIGAPLGTGVSIIIGNVFIINWYYSRKVNLEIKRFFKQTYGKIFPIILIVTLLSSFVNQRIPFSQNWIVFIIKAIVITMIYIAIIYSFGMNNDEKKELTLKGG